MARNSLAQYGIVGGGLWLGYSMALAGSLGGDMQKFALQTQAQLHKAFNLGVGDGAVTPKASTPQTLAAKTISPTLAAIGVTSARQSIVKHDGTLVPSMNAGWRTYPQADPEMGGKIGIYETDDHGNFNGPIAWA
jgi:hypothetical protein